MDNATCRTLDTSCFRCGECCRRYQVLLDRSEVQRLANYLNISPEDFVSRYADTRWPGVDKYLVRQENGDCVFLRGTDREFLCAVHEVKPQACLDWAAAYSRPECLRGLEYYWHLSIDSSGHLKGRPGEVVAFARFLKRFSAEEKTP